MEGKAFTQDFEDEVQSNLLGHVTADQEDLSCEKPGEEESEEEED